MFDKRFFKSGLARIGSFFLALSISCSVAYGQATTGTIVGKIKSANGEGLEYVSVTLKGTSIGTIPNKRGEFKLLARAGKYILAISHTGYMPITKKVAVESGVQLNVGTILLHQSDQKIDEVTVKGSRRNKFTSRSSEYAAKLPLKRLENPQTYSSISSELMESQQTYSVKDALNNVSSIHKLWDANGRAATGGAYYSLRGFTTQAMLRNGVAGNVSTTIDVSNLERIEVIKGPSGTLYGSTVTSFGGLINRVTKKPQQDTFGTISLAGGDFSTYRVSADYNTPLNKDRSVLLRLNSAYRSNSTFQDAGFGRSFSFAPSLSYQVNDRLHVRVDGEFIKTKNADFQGIYLSSTPDELGVHKVSDTKINFDLAYKANDIYSNSNVGNLFGEAVYQLAPNWTSKTNISFATTRSSGDAPFFYLMANSSVTGDPSDVGSDYLERCIWRPEGNDQTFEIQENITGDFNLGPVKNKLTVGLDYDKYSRSMVYYYFVGNYKGLSSYYMYDYVNLNGAMTNYFNFNQAGVDQAYTGTENTQNTLFSDSKTSTYSAYAIDVLKFSPKLSALLSARIDHFENKAIFNPLTATATDGYGQTAISPKFGLVYQPVVEKVAFFGNYQNGFANVAPVTQPDGTVSDFDPEQANQWEGGVKLNLLDDRFVATLSYYDIKVKNNTRSVTKTFEQDGVSSTGQFTVQNGTQYSRGFEAEITANPAEGLNFVAGYAHNKSKWEKSDDDVEGLRPINSGPENAANVWGSYQLTHGRLANFGIGLGANYSDELLIANTKSGGRFELPAYTVMNGSLFYDNQIFRIGLSCRNMNDKHYFVGYSTITPQSPRQLMLDMKFRF